MEDFKELEQLQNIALEITRLCSEYSRRAQTETHEELESLWNRIQELKSQLRDSNEKVE